MDGRTNYSFNWSGSGAWIRSSQTEGRGGSDGTGTAEAAVTCLVFGEWSCLPYAILQILNRSLSLTPLYSCDSGRAKLDLGSHGGRRGDREKGVTLWVGD